MPGARFAPFAPRNSRSRWRHDTPLSFIAPVMFPRCVGFRNQICGRIGTDACTRGRGPAKDVLLFVMC